MKPNKPSYLIAKYLTKQAAVSDLDQLSQWIGDPKEREEFMAYVKLNYAIDYSMKKFDSEHAKSQLLKFIQRERKSQRLKNLSKYAALLAVLLCAGYFLKQGSFGPEALDGVPVVSTDGIEPGSDRAVLSLEDGTQVQLDNGKTIQTEKLSGNGKKLVYSPSSKGEGEVSYNQLSIPRGGQYHLVLADGTQVWLNSETKLRYPTSFVKGAVREVELLYGEAYFEVSPSTAHQGARFKVQHPDQEIEVYGTHFNVKAYKDENSIYTTLVEGKVSVGNGNSQKILMPNQQSVLDLESRQFGVHPADATLEISWIKGIFGFKNKSMEDIAKVLSRWYAVDFDFSNEQLKGMKFNGVLSKEESLGDILGSIETTKAIQD